MSVGAGGQFVSSVDECGSRGGGQFVSTLNEYGREPIVINVNMSGRLQLVSSVNENSGAEVGGGEGRGGDGRRMAFHSFICPLIYSFIYF